VTLAPIFHNAYDSRAMHDAMQDAGRHGPTWRVLLSATPGTMPTVSNTPSSTPSVNGLTPSTTPSIGDETPAFLEALRLLDALRQENRDLAGQVGYLQARVQLHEETIRALTAPQSPVEALGATEPPDLTPEPFWTRSPRGWIAGTATVLAIVAAVVLLGWR